MTTPRAFSILPQPCDCSSCPADANFTCSYIGEDQLVEDAYIANVYRGNLSLTPRDSSPRHYVHQLFQRHLLQIVSESIRRTLAVERLDGKSRCMAMLAEGPQYVRIDSDLDVLRSRPGAARNN